MVETHQRDLNTETMVEGYQMADAPATRLFWAVATLTLAWVVGLIGDWLGFECWEEQAGVDWAV